MNRTLTFTSAAVVVALGLAALPADAQAHRSSGQQSGGGRATASQSAPRQAPRAVSAQPRQSTSRAPESRSYSGSAPAYRPPTGRSYSAQRSGPSTSSGRSYQAGPSAVPRTYGGSSDRAPSYRGPSSGYGGGRGYAAPAYRGYNARPGTVRPYFSRNYNRPYGWMPYRPYRFVRPYYVFSPWLSLGFGLWCGYPVDYPWGYLGDYQPTVFGDPDENYQVAGNASTYGGASFDIQPSDADLFIDGQYAGPVSDFAPNSEPLTLEPGPHRFAIQREGYRPMEWDVTIEPGQVIPYRGVLDRQ